MNAKLLYIVWMGAVFSLVLGSCKKKDNPQPVNPITGTWARDSYDLTVPAPFVKHWGGTYYNVGESGYTIVFVSDKTYSRSFTGYSVKGVVGDVNDTGTWTQDTGTLTLKPASQDDTDKILDPNYWPIGLVFNIDTDITIDRMNLSRAVKLSLVPDLILDTLKSSSSLQATDYQLVDVTIAYKFRKVK
jgi:hypothetical protein